MGYEEITTVSYADDTVSIAENEHNSEFIRNTRLIP